MNRFLPLLLCAVACLVAADSNASMIIELDAGHLFSSDTTSSSYLSTGANGALLQIIASTSGTFAAPTAESFTGGDPNEMVIANLAMNSFSGPDETDNTFNISLTGSFAAGDALMLRWFPSLSLNEEQGGATPALGMDYGQFQGSDADGGLGWVLPDNGASDTGTNGLFFLTESSGGAHSDSEGIASLTIQTVPEPTIPGLFFVAITFLGFFLRGRKGRIV
jgi:hypothetical protein